MTTDTVYLSLGSNLGDREQMLAAALSRIESIEGMEVTATSAIYATEAEDMVAGSPPFLNQVIKTEYQYPPLELLHTLEKIETEMGRTDKGLNQPRTIDIDILTFGDTEMKTEQLTLPHPKFMKRAFVLIPMLQIDPDLTHPISGKPLADKVAADAHSKVVLYKDHVARQV